MATSEQAQATELLRLVTCGSVDDGKSTLIGRLLYDTKQIFVDQLEHIEDVSRRRGHGYVDLALLTDGLRAEREQGITIDVAYRSFVTPRRRFQLADAPGHVQYTRNMVTGASTAELGIVLVDARQGVVEQTRRHAYILSILRVPHAVVAVNKMDLVDWSQERFDEIAAQLEELGLPDLVVIPISALQGDNVVDRSENMPWYDGPLLLEHLEGVEIASDRDLDSRRFPVQWVIRPRSDEHHDYRGYGGQVAGGVWSAGDEVVVLPAGLKTQVEAVETIDGPLEAAIPPMSVTVRLTDDLDVSRGDMLADPADPPTVARELEARVCWMSEQPLEPRARLAVKQTSRSVRAIADELVSRIDVHTLEDVAAPERLELNDIGVVHLRLSEPLCVDPYEENRATGAFVLIDEATNETIGAGHGPLGVMTWQFALTRAWARADRRPDRRGRGLADDADPDHPLRLQADHCRRHGHRPRCDLQIVRRSPASPAQHGARPPRVLAVHGVGPAGDCRRRDLVQAPELDRERGDDPRLCDRRRAHRRRQRLPRQGVRETRGATERGALHHEPPRQADRPRAPARCSASSSA